MKLRQQLALLALVGLLIPGLTLYSLRIFNEQVKNSRLTELTSVAQAIAARLGSDNDLLLTSGLADTRPLPRDQTLYSHLGDGPIIVDGAVSDWQALAIAPLPLPGDAGLTATYRSLTRQDTTYWLIEVADSQRLYHRPGSSQLASGDHLLLYAARPEQRGHYYVLRAEVPGPTQAVYRNFLGQAVTEERIRGVWRETQSGYRVELALPTAMTQGATALAAVDKSDAGPVATAGTLAPFALAAAGPDPGVLPAASGQLLRPAPALNRALDVFAQPGTRLSLLDRHRWLRGQAGELSAPHAEPSWPQNLLGYIVRRPERQPTANRSGLWLNELAPDAGAAPAAYWTQEQGVLIATVDVPLIGHNLSIAESRQLGRLVIEQKIPPWQLFDQTVITRLLTSSLLGGGLILLLLLGYASFLSARIARLSRAAGHATGQNLPQALAQWPEFKLNDEIAGLSRRYSDLLTQLQDHNDYLRTLTGKLSHELRTPLAVVTGSLDNLLQGESDKETIAKYARRALAGSERLSAIVSAMTEASRVEASIGSAEKEVVDLQQLISEIGQAYQSAYPQQNFEVLIRPAAPGVYSVRVAPELLVQMLDKLVDNAVSFARENTPIQLALEAISHESDGVQLILSVTNQGPQLPEAIKGKLFQSLTSQRSRSQDDTPHLGLGLYIVDLIARFHDGMASAENLPDGVRFKVTLPAQYANLSAQRPPTSVDNGH